MEPAAPALFKALISPSEFLILHAIASFFSTLCLGIVVIGLRRQLTSDLIKQILPLLLKVLTVYLIIWTGTELALVGAFGQGISTLFAAIIGYVFGSYKSSPPAKQKDGLQKIGVEKENTQE